MAPTMSDSSALHAQMHNYNDNPIHLFHTADKPANRSDLADCWLIDSGVSRTMSTHWHWFQAYSPLDPPCKIWLGDNTYSIFRPSVSVVSLSTCTLTASGTEPSYKMYSTSQNSMATSSLCPRSLYMAHKSIFHPKPVKFGTRTIY